RRVRVSSLQSFDPGRARASEWQTMGESCSAPLKLAAGVTAGLRNSRAQADAQVHDPSLGCTRDRARPPESACHAATMAGAQWREMADGAGAETPGAETPERMGVTRA